MINMKRYMLLCADEDGQGIRFFDNWSECESVRMDCEVCAGAFCQVYEWTEVIDEETGKVMFSRYEMIY